MSPTAKALYPVMRSYGYFDFDEYVEIKDLEAEYNDHQEVYRDREFDFCEAERLVLIEKAGIHPRSFNNAIENLIENNLVKRLEYQKWAVFILPRNNKGTKIYYKRDFLNKKIMNSYKHERK